jgi:hypothetical protein
MLPNADLGIRSIHYNGILYAITTLIIMDFHCTQKTGKTIALNIIIFEILNGGATVHVFITCNSDKEGYQ